MFDSEDPAAGYALVWPHDLFGRELKALHDGQYSETELGHRMVLLFEEAFVGPHPAEDAEEVTRRSPWASVGANPSFPARDLAQQVLRTLSSLPMHSRKQYYRERHAGYGSTQDAPSFWNDPFERAQHELSDAIARLQGQGYFDHCGGHRCDDAPTADTHVATMRRLIEDRTMLDVSWPHFLSPGGTASPLNQDDFLTLVEVLHDFVARPRRRYDHEYAPGEGHHDYSDFHERAGQGVYRWRVNTIFARIGLGFRIAEEGADVGLVVTTVGDPRAELEQVASQNVPDGEENRERINHAIALFRGRSASVADKRSACKDLADVLENRRPLIKKRLVKKDEGALFQIANDFGIRHHDGKQRTDYAQEEFLDWIFWNYLSAIELSNRLIGRSPASDTHDG